MADGQTGQTCWVADPSQARFERHNKSPGRLAWSVAQLKPQRMPKLLIHAKASIRPRRPEGRATDAIARPQRLWNVHSQRIRLPGQRQGGEGVTRPRCARLQQSLSLLGGDDGVTKCTYEAASLPGGAASGGDGRGRGRGSGEGGEDGEAVGKGHESTVALLGMRPGDDAGPGQRSIRASLPILDSGCPIAV